MQTSRLLALARTFWSAGGCTSNVSSHCILRQSYKMLMKIPKSPAFHLRSPRRPCASRGHWLVYTPRHFHRDVAQQGRVRLVERLDVSFKRLKHSRGEAYRGKVAFL